METDPAKLYMKSEVLMQSLDAKLQYKVAIMQPLYSAIQNSSLHYFVKILTSFGASVIVIEPPFTVTESVPS